MWVGGASRTLPKTKVLIVSKICIHLNNLSIELIPSTGGFCYMISHNLISSTLLQSEKEIRGLYIQLNMEWEVRGCHLMKYPHSYLFICYVSQMSAKYFN